MQLLPPCSFSPIEEIPASEELLPYQDPLGGFPEQGFPEQGFPEQGFPEQGFPEQGFPEQGFPEQGFPEQGVTGGDFPSEDDETEEESEDELLPTREMNPECDVLSIGNIEASGFETDPSDYHPPTDAIDGDPSTWWSHNDNDPWLEIDLGSVQTICGVSVQWNKGEERDYSFNVEVSQDGTNYEKVLEGENDKGSTESEIYPLEQETDGRYIKLTTTDTSSGDGWVSIQEIGAIGIPLL
jgi:hypothetical protein